MTSKETQHEYFSTLLKEMSKKIESFNPENKSFSILLKDGSKKSLPKFFAEIKEGLLEVDLTDYAALLPRFKSQGVFKDFFEEYCESGGLIEGSDEEKREQVYPHLKLYMDQESKEGDLFTVDKETSKLSPISGKVYVSKNGYPPKFYNQLAVAVSKRYEPRKPLGEYKELINGRDILALNVYNPPEWVDLVPTVKISKEPPELLSKLVNHLFPLKVEREFFYSWLYYSLYKRAYTFLVLCGAPGIGKNILKKIIRALHGFDNSVDGKKSTFSERFNSQVRDCTLLWFDELKYDAEMENAMKEIQNDTMSVEGKSIDATRSTRIHCSMVIVNNKPRDNYIDFEARKFVPLQMNRERLEVSMKPAEISRLVHKVEDHTNDKYDNNFLAEIGEWLKQYGKSDKWPTLEYRGPMFYKLAHTSMTRWQKKTIQLIIEFMDRRPGKVEFDEEKGFRWSTMLKVEEARKAGKGTQFPAHSSVEAFLESFKDGYGRECFETTTHDSKMNIDEDFWVKCIVDEIKIFNKQDLKTRSAEVISGEENNVGRSEEGKRQESPNSSKTKERKNGPLEEKEERRRSLSNRRTGNRRLGQQDVKEESIKDLL